MSVAQHILTILADVAEWPAVAGEPDRRLYDEQVLDSLRTVELIVAFEQAFGIEISPAELDREQWATPRRIVADLERRLQP